MVPATPSAAAAFAAFELLAPSPAPSQPIRRHSHARSTQTPVDSIQDVSELDFGDMLVADEALLSDDDVPSFGSIDDSFAPTKASESVSDRLNVLQPETPSTSAQHGASSTSSVPAVREPATAGQGPSRGPRQSILAPLPSLPPPALPAAPPLETFATTASPAPLIVRTSASKKRPRASLSRPAHILPETHPAHPRPRPSLLPVLDDKPKQAEAVISSIEDKDVEGGTGSVPARLRQARRSSVAAPARPLTVQPALLSPNLAPIPRIEEEPSSAAHEEDDDSLDYVGEEMNFGDLSVPAIADLARSTSTPARPNAVSATSALRPLLQQSQQEQDGPASNKRRRTTVAFALPPLQEHSADDDIAALEHQSSRHPTEPARPPLSLKRRASRAFDSQRDKENATAAAQLAHKPFVIKKASSLEHSQVKRRVSLAPLARSAQRVEQFKTPLLPRIEDEAPVTIIHLAPRVAAPENASNNRKANVDSALQTRTAPIKPKGGLTLPRDFAFRSQNDEREAERKRRIAERETAKAEEKRKQVEPLPEVVHVKPATKAVPFNFSTTLRVEHQVEATALKTGPFDFHSQNRKSNAGQAPSLKALGKRPAVTAKPILSSKARLLSNSSRSAPATGPEWISRTEQRRQQREDWSKRQREREEARQQSLQTEIKMKQERERSKLQALRASLVPCQRQ
ncbi:hypothetical protein ACM66B_001028 [Microbotryomycetes sp. NB124-2]